jgi:hypothetical protein
MKVYLALLVLLIVVAGGGIASSASVDNIFSSVQCQNDGFMNTNTFASVTQGTAGIGAPIGCNNTMYQSAYSESSFIAGQSMYIKNVSVTAPSQAGASQLIKTNRQIDAFGSIISDEAIMVNVFGQVPQNNTNAQRLYGSETANKLVFSSSNIMADSLTMQSNMYAHNGAQDILFAPTGLVSPMAVGSDIQSIISGTGFSTFTDFSVSQHGPLMTCNTSPSISATDVYYNKLQVTGKSVVIKQFNFQEQVKPPIQLITPIVVPLCSW